MLDFNSKLELKDKLPLQAINDVYEFTKLQPVDLWLYWSWACDARARKIPIAPLATVASRLEKCPRTSNAFQSCLHSIRHALKLPEDIFPDIADAAETMLEDYARRSAPA